MIPIPPLVLARLAAQFGLDAAELSHLGGGREDSDGTLFAAARGCEQVVLKVLPNAGADGLAAAHERLHFTRFLGEHGAPIVYPLPAQDGRLLVVDEAPGGSGDAFMAYLMERIPGAPPRAEQMAPELYRAWGQAVGRLHRITQQYPPWPEICREGRPLLGWEVEVDGFTGASGADTALRAAWLRVKERLRALPRARENFGFVHNDPHEQNLIVDGERLTLIDFDVANYHWFAAELAIAMQGKMFAQTGGIERPCTDAAPLRAFLDAFLSGYARENTLEAAELARIDLFIHYRRLLLFTVMQGWLATQPDLRAGWWRMIETEPEVLGGA
jgi:Ser/Thr protein kinase RdoA (MazF antagonist)